MARQRQKVKINLTMSSTCDSTSDGEILEYDSRSSRVDGVSFFLS